jgi:hypothetical protein
LSPGLCLDLTGVNAFSGKHIHHFEGGREVLPGPLSYEDIFSLDLIPTASTAKAAHIRLRLGIIISTGNPLSVNFFFEKAELDAGVKPRATTRPSQPVMQSG